MSRKQRTALIFTNDEKVIWSILTWFISYFCLLYAFAKSWTNNNKNLILYGIVKFNYKQISLVFKLIFLAKSMINRPLFDIYIFFVLFGSWTEHALIWFIRRRSRIKTIWLRTKVSCAHLNAATQTSDTYPYFVVYFKIMCLNNPLEISHLSVIFLVTIPVVTVFNISISLIAYTQRTALQCPHCCDFCYNFECVCVYDCEKGRRRGGNKANICVHIYVSHMYEYAHTYICVYLHTYECTLFVNAYKYTHLHGFIYACKCT